MYHEEYYVCDKCGVKGARHDIPPYLQSLDPARCDHFCSDCTKIIRRIINKWIKEGVKK